MFGVRTYFNSTFDTKWRCQAKFHSSISGDRFNFCNQFFNLGMGIYEKIEKYIWFHISGSYTSEKINHNNRSDFPKHLNRNQALFRHKSHMTADLYLVYILGIRANWENWKRKPQTTWDTQKIFPDLQLHNQHLIRSSS